MRTRIALAIALLLLSVAATSSEERTRQLLDAFSKTKYKHRQKRGVSKSLFKDIHAEAVIPASRAGTYIVSGLDYELRLDESLRGSGSDDGREFTLRDARLDGALLTATKVYRDGTTEAFEALFMNRVERDGTSPDAVTSTQKAFGLGVLLPVPVRRDGATFTRLFYEKH